MPAAIPPRLLTEEQAAEYLGAIPVAEVRRAGIGRVPVGKYVRYDIRALDAWLDSMSGIAPKSPPPAANQAEEDPAEAALARFKNRA
jgi:hypothetical protein